MNENPGLCVARGLAAGLLLSLSSTAEAQSLFTAGFDDFTAPGGNFNGGQFQSDLAVVHTGNLPDWSKSGAGTVHAVDHANAFPSNPATADFAVMIWHNNVITLSMAIAGSNDAGAAYLVEFEASPAVYQAPSQVTTATDGLLIEVLREDGTVLQSHIHEPGPWAGNIELVPDSFEYVGDGSGEITLRIGPSAFNSQHFGGAIDNLEVSLVNPLGPKIFSFTADPEVLADAAEPVTLAWEVELPLDALTLAPGDLDLLPSTDGAGMGNHPIDPGPDGTTEYTLTATRNGDSISRKVTVTLPAPTISSFKASPSPLPPGNELTLSWEVGLPAATLTIAPGDLDVSGATDGNGAGSITIDPGPGETTTYTLTATRGTSTSTAQATAIVRTPPNPNAIFYDDFDSLTGAIFNGAQFESGLDLAHSGTLPGWQGSGLNDVHAVDLANQTGNIANPRDFAVMIWQDNVITLIDPIANSNQAGAEYLVEFDAGPAVYQAGSQTTSPTDGLLIELLRNDDTVHSEFVLESGAWAGFPTLLPASFTYSGDGSGDLRLRVGPSAFGSGRFGGAIDNVTVSPSILPRVRITDLSHHPVTSEFSISWESADGKLYNLRSETDPSAAEPLDWPIFGDQFDLSATPPENTLTIPMPPEAARFFVIEEFNAPPASIFADDFESGQGLWTTGSDGAAGTVWELGAPTNVGPSASHSPANCFATNLSSDYEIDATVWLRSPPIDLTTAGGATLSYFQFIDIEEGFDLGRVSVLDSTDDSVLALLQDNLDGVSVDWSQITKVLPPEALGKTIVIEFRLMTDDVGNFAGWYVDDVNVTVP